MIKIKKLFCIFIIIILNSSVVFAQDCSDLKSCTEVVSKITERKYIFAAHLNKKMTVTSNFSLSKKDAESLFPAILSTVDLARVKIGPETFKIIPAKDLRYQNFQVVKVNLDTKEIPADLNKEDYYTFEYYFKHGDHGQPVFAVEAIRLMLSKYGRVFTVGKSLLVHDKSIKFYMALKVAQGADRDLNSDDVKKLVEHLKETAKYYDKK